MLIGLFNHNNTDNTLKLKQGFATHDVFVVDSGTELTEEEKKAFDLTLPNVYYGGLLNAIGDQLSDREANEVVLFFATDVEVADEQAFARRLEEVFADPEIGLYAPAVNAEGSNHPQMRHKAGKGLCKVPFVDGFCFAVRSSVYKKIHPIDTSINKVGWGIDAFLAFKSFQSGYECVVDHQNKVTHFVGPNHLADPKPYLQKAKSERMAWYRVLEERAENKGFRLFRKLLHFEFVKNRFGAGLFGLLFKTRSR